MSKFDDEFLKYVKTTNISTGSNTGLIVADDKFWLLSLENIGVDEEFLIKSDDSLFKFFLNNDDLRRTFNDAPCFWWLRSASSTDNYNVGDVDEYGYVYNYHARYDSGVLPACIIR